MTFNPASGRVVTIRPDDPSKYQTYIGGLRAGSALLKFVEEAYAKYSLKRYYDNDFGQGANGLVVVGPGGSIGFSLEGNPTADRLTTITDIVVGEGVHATAAESGCS